MTLSEHLEQTSFAYDPQFPPDVPAGKRLSDARVCPPQPRVKRAWRTCTRLVGRKR